MEIADVEGRVIREDHPSAIESRSPPPADTTPNEARKLSAHVFAGGSGVQFWFGLRRGKPDDSGEVDVSLDGVKVRSQFLGVVTLALSLAFFYLYLKTVYPIVEIADTHPAAHDKR